MTTSYIQGTLFNYLTHNFNYPTPNLVLFGVQFLTYRRQCFDVMRYITLCLTLPILGLTLSSLIGGTNYFLCKMRPIHEITKFGHTFMASPVTETVLCEYSWVSEFPCPINLYSWYWFFKLWLCTPCHFVRHLVCMKYATHYPILPSSTTLVLHNNTNDIRFFNYMTYFSCLEQTFNTLWVDVKYQVEAFRENDFDSDHGIVVGMR